jgi:hypothetical protein
MISRAAVLRQNQKRPISAACSWSAQPGTKGIISGMSTKIFHEKAEGQTQASRAEAESSSKLSRCAAGCSVYSERWRLVRTLDRSFAWTFKSWGDGRRAAVICRMRKPDYSPRDQRKMGAFQDFLS